jgi:hypothetical protein
LKSVVPAGPLDYVYIITVLLFFLVIIELPVRGTTEEKGGVNGLFDTVRNRFK